MESLIFNKRIVAFCIICFCAVGILFAQTASEIETLLKVSAVTYGQAAGFVLRAADAVKTSNAKDAFNLAIEKNWLPKNVSADSQARLDVISMLFMKSFGLKGGLFYSLFKNPHYAYRELAARKAFKGKSGPNNAVSGDQLLFITNRVLSIAEGE